MRALCLLSALITAGCAAEDSHPAEYKNPDATMAIPRKCNEVRGGEVQQGNAIWVDGAPAACGSDGQVCPISDLNAFASVCKVGPPFGGCQTTAWVVLCELDAGLTDAAAD